MNKLLEEDSSTTLYRITDDAQVGRPIYLRVINGVYGPWIECYYEDPRQQAGYPEDSPYPDTLIHLDYFDAELRIKIWEEGTLSRAGDDASADKELHLMTQEALEESEESENSDAA